MVTIPESTFWSIIVIAVVALVGLGRQVMVNGSSIKALEDNKQSKTHCLEVHGALRAEIVAISKDVEALTKQAGIKPQPSPARNGGTHSAPREE